MVKANVDMIVDYLRTKKSASLPEISKFLSIPKEDVQKSIQYLEEDGIIKIDYKLTTPFAILIKDPNTGVIPPPPPFETGQKVKEPEQQQSQQGQQIQASQPFQQQQQVQQQPQQFNQQQPPLQSSYIDIKKEEKPFLLNSTQDEHTIFTPDPNKNLNASLTFMQPVNDSSAREEKFDLNPLDYEKPKFDLNPPSPISGRETKEEKPYIKSALAYGETYKEDKETTIFPSYIETTIEKIDFMVDFVNKKIANHEYKDLNVIYRRIYNLMIEGEDLSPNERYLAGEKINELFQRIRRIYLIEGVVI